MLVEEHPESRDRQEDVDNISQGHNVVNKIVFDLATGVVQDGVQLLSATSSPPLDESMLWYSVFNYAPKKAY